MNTLRNSSAIFILSLAASALLHSLVLVRVSGIEVPGFTLISTAFLADLVQEDTLPTASVLRRAAGRHIAEHGPVAAETQFSEKSGEETSGDSVLPEEEETK